MPDTTDTNTPGTPTSLQGQKGVPEKPVLQMDEKYSKKKRMTTLPLLAISLVSLAAAPLVWTVTDQVLVERNSQYEEQNSDSNLEQNGQETAAESVDSANENDTQEKRHVFSLPIPSVENALAFFEDRQFVAHFAERLGVTSSASNDRADEKTHRAAPVQASVSTSSRQRVRIHELDFPEPPVLPGDPEAPRKAYGVYLTPSTAADNEKLEYTMQSLVDRGATAIVVDVKGSFVYFPTDAELPNELGLVRPVYDLQQFVDRAHEKGLYVIGRYIALKDGPLGDVNGGAYSMRHPTSNVDLQTLWVEPSNPTVLEYNRQAIRDAALTGIDEINLDYIRYPTSLPQTLSLIPTEEKARRIEMFIQMARDEIDAVGLGTKLGISSYAILGWNYEANLPNLGQDVVRFAPLLDVISPMAYPSTFSPTGYGSDPNGRSRDYWLVYRTMTGYADLIGEEHVHKLRPWIQAYYKNPTNIRDQIDAVIDAGGCGFTMWSASNEYGNSYSAFSNWKQPEQCQPTI